MNNIRPLLRLSNKPPDSNPKYPSKLATNGSKLHAFMGEAVTDVFTQGRENNNLRTFGVQSSTAVALWSKETKRGGYYI